MSNSENKNITQQNKLVVFQNKNIRRIWQDEEWFYSVVDIIEVLTDSPTPRQYWGKVKDREFTKLQLSPIWVRLKLTSNDGKKRLTDCVNTKGAFRLIQSIPSKKAEPFKQWLAQVGKERLDEIENPELAQERMKEISKATFGMTPGEYREFKNLPAKSKINLRDNMDDLELIFTMLGERVTTEISKNEEPDTFDESKNVAKRGGRVAGNARKETEKELGRSVITKKNFPGTDDKLKLKELLKGSCDSLILILNS